LQMTEGVALELPTRSMRSLIRPIAFWGSLILLTHLALTPYEPPEIILFRFNDKILHVLGSSGKSVFWAVNWQEPVLS
jgi:hypothetical protein